MNERSIRRQLPLAFGLVAGMLAGPTLLRAAHYTRLFLLGGRQPLWRAPADLGMTAEDVTFAAADGVALRGWFIERAGGGAPGPAVVLVHGWPWNRCGNRAGAIPLMDDRTVDFMSVAHALHRAGFHVLMFDLRNHGVSAAAPPVTFGVHEARDVVGAVAYLRGRPEVDGARIGALGFSMGANAVIFGAPAAQPLRAAMLVQPVAVGTFLPRFVGHELRPLAPLMNALASPLTQALGGPPVSAMDPRDAVRDLGDTEVLFVQGAGDQWGALDEVRRMAESTPNARSLLKVPSQERYGGYSYVIDHPEEAVLFFQEALG
jgi:pimeloyl-ACP methyl ester carboxylesterase